jgi:hypothetical protein
MRRSPIALGVGACSVVALVWGGAAWGVFSAHAVNNADAFSAGTLQLKSVTPDSVNCYSTGAGSGGSVTTNVTQCPGDELPTGQLVLGTGVNASTTLSSPGTSAATSLTASTLACGVEQVADASAAANPGLLYAGVTYGTSFTSPVHPAFTSTGVTLDGVAGSFLGTTVQQTNPLVFSLVAWVRTTSANGGSIIGFSSNQADKGTSADRMAWVDNTGHVVFEVLKAGVVQEVTSTGVVNDGVWHLVVATLSSSGMFLYVDNQAAVSNTTVTTAKNYSGYWHLGWSGNAAVADASTDAYLAGSLVDAAVLTTALSAASVSSLYNATSAAAYAAVLQAASPAGYWPLNDTGTVPYTGTIPALGAGVSICSRVRFELQATAGPTTTCVYPAAAGACAAKPPVGSLLSSFSSSAMPVLSAVPPNSFLVIMDLNNASASGVLGLHLLPDLAITAALGSWSAQLQYLAASVEL